VRRASINGQRFYSADNNTQTYLFIEYGVARTIEWNDEVAPTLPDDNKALFEGVMRIEYDVNTGEKTIKGRYVIDDGTVIEINNDVITVY
jgi:hypothetical protein